MFEQFKSLFSTDEQQWTHFTSFFKRINVPAKTELLSEGEFPKKLFVIEKGALRAWFNHNGKGITFQFFFENEVVSSIESFRKHTPSPVTIETLEASTIWWAHKTDIDILLEYVKNDPKMRDMLIDAIFERTFDYMKYFFSTIKDTPQQRYLDLINARPQIIKRLPQHYIASYLGITTVHLSRIKGKLSKAV
jgi:CRP-like cAMP-binding protein